MGVNFFSFTKVLGKVLSHFVFTVGVNILSRFITWEMRRGLINDGGVAEDTVHLTCSVLVIPSFSGLGKNLSSILVGSFTPLN